MSLFVLNFTYTSYVYRNVPGQCATTHYMCYFIILSYFSPKDNRGQLAPGHFKMEYFCAYRNSYFSMILGISGKLIVLNIPVNTISSYSDVI